MVRELLKNAAEKLTESESPMLDARVLLAKAMNRENAALIFENPDEKEISLFNSFIEKRASGIPVAYILGEKEFMGLNFHLNSDTLIPRPDTECLAEKVIEKNSLPSPRILDLCTGSGCLGISLLKFISGATCDLTDISEGALNMAKENASLNGVADRANVFRLDVLKDSIEKEYDIIVSNPPYIETEIVPTLEVSRFEPQRALDGGTDGLDFYRIISDKAFNSLKAGGMLALEIGYNQASPVTTLLEKFSEVNLYKDYGNNDRVIIAIK